MWPDPRVVELVNSEFTAVRVHVQEQAEEFKRLGKQYGAEWTPTTLVLDPSGAEQHRIEGFLPAPEFLAQLTIGLGRVQFAREAFAEAERRFQAVVDGFADTDAAPEALYWAGVARYKQSSDPAALQDTAARLRERYPDSTWRKKASVWDRG